MGYQKDAQYARNAGLYVENIHTPVHEQNNLSLDNLNGESVFNNYIQCVKDCNEYEISTMVIHLPNDKYPLNELGMRRIGEIVDIAELKSVRIAFENLNNVENLSVVLKIFPSKNVGFCYDSCHHINYACNINLLNMYGNRLFALHLQDNGGVHNQHQLPFDGKIEWRKVMNTLALTGYKGPTTLEPMNWDYMHLSIEKFLDLAYHKAKKLDEMRVR